MNPLLFIYPFTCWKTVGFFHFLGVTPKVSMDIQNPALPLAGLENNYFMYPAQMSNCLQRLHRGQLRNWIIFSFHQQISLPAPDLLSLTSLRPTSPWLSPKTFLPPKKHSHQPCPFTNDTSRRWHATLTWCKNSVPLGHLLPKPLTSSLIKRTPSWGTVHKIPDEYFSKLSRS